MAFSGAHHFEIRSAAFVNNIVYNSPNSTPIDILRGARAIEATDKSNTAVYAPKCKKGTRVQIISDIMDWVETPTSRVLWFSGPAGGGKTCIMREVVVRCHEAGLPTWTYFFSTRIGGLTIERPFVATLVYQLIATIPALKPFVLQAISENPAIFDESLDSQMESLVIQPLRLSPSIKVVIVIDGFDECLAKQERQHLLMLLHFLLHQPSHSIFVIVSSRPEFDIRTAFDDPLFKPITRTLRLHDYDGTEDVRHFYCDEFEKIRRTHPMKESIPEGWPTEPTLDTLMFQSSGNFNVPAIIMKYINNPRRNPMELLKNAMSKTSTSTAEHPLADIDALYSFILHPPDTDIPLMKRILHAIIGITVALPHPVNYSPAFLDQFFELTPGTVQSTLCDLHSILSVPSLDPNEKYDPIRFHHRSLEEFLLSPERSKDLFQSPHDTQIDLVLTCGRHLQKWADNPCTAIVEKSPLDYSSSYWHEHFCLSFEGQQGQEITLPDAILSFDPRVICICFWVYGAVLPLLPIHSEFHSAMCVDGTCLPLCKLLKRMNECNERIRGFECLEDKIMGSSEQMEQRLKVLPRFKTETGLYDLVDEEHGILVSEEVEQVVPPATPSPPQRIRGPSKLDRMLARFSRRG